MRSIKAILAALVFSLGAGVVHGGPPRGSGGDVVMHTLPRGAVAKLCLRLQAINHPVRISREQAIGSVGRSPFIARAGIRLQFVEARIAIVYLNNHYLFNVRDPLWVLVATYKRAFRPDLFFVDARTGIYVGYLTIGQPCLP